MLEGVLDIRAEIFRFSIRQRSSPHRIRLPPLPPPGKREEGKKVSGLVKP